MLLYSELINLECWTVAVTIRSLKCVNANNRVPAATPRQLGIMNENFQQARYLARSPGCTAVEPHVPFSSLLSMINHKNFQPLLESSRSRGPYSSPE